MCGTVEITTLYILKSDNVHIDNDDDKSVSNDVDNNDDDDNDDDDDGNDDDKNDFDVTCPTLQYIKHKKYASK